MVNFFTSHFRSLHLLNITQFLGALNDNIFKLFVIFLLINLQGAESANHILGIAGIVFVIPFLLFSAAAGVLADRLSKSKILVWTKVLEVFLMSLAVVAIYKQSPIASYTILFCMGAQSAIFGPSKYGIIPELVESRFLSRANGLMSSFTYLAIILGSFLASFITDITHKNFTLASTVCVLIAILGYLTSLGIRKTAPQGAKKKINPFFPYEIYQSIKIALETPHLLTVIFGSAFFLFIGAYTQLNMIPFAIQALGLTETGGGYLFLITAIGIAIGSLIAGKISKDRVEVGLACIGSFLLSVFFILLTLFSFSLILTIPILFLLGLSGGLLVVPFDAFIQVESREDQRGRIIALNSFLSFVGVLLAALFILLIGDRFNFSARSGFFLTGCLTFAFSLFITGRMAVLFFPFLAEKFLLYFYVLQTDHPLPPKGSILVFQGPTLDLLVLFALLPKLKVVRPTKIFRALPYSNHIFTNFYRSVYTKHRKITLHKAFLKAGGVNHCDYLCLFLDKNYAKKEIQDQHRTHSTKDRPLYFIKSSWDTVQKVFFSSAVRQKQITFSFEE